MTTERATLRPISATDPDARGGATHSVRGDELEVGDVLYFLGTPHRITHFDPYTGPLDFIDRIARSGNPRWAGDKGWGMSIDPTGRYRIG